MISSNLICSALIGLLTLKTAFGQWDPSGMGGGGMGGGGMGGGDMGGGGGMMGGGGKKWPN